MRMAAMADGLAMPKSLRHAFGVDGTQTGVPLNLIQRWLGHADIETTAIYTDVLGEEERISQIAHVALEVNIRQQLRR